MKASSRMSKRKTLDCWQNFASLAAGVPIDLLATKIIKRLCLIAVPNKLEHEWKPPGFSAFPVVSGTMTRATNTFKTIRFLGTKKSQDWRYQTEMALSEPSRQGLIGLST